MVDGATRSAGTCALPDGGRAAPAIDLRRLASLAELDQRRRLPRRPDRRFPRRSRSHAGRTRAGSGRARRTRLFRDHAHALRSSAAHVGALGTIRPVPRLARARRPCPADAGTGRAASACEREAGRVAAAMHAFYSEWELRLARPAGRPRAHRAAATRRSACTGGRAGAPGDGRGSPSGAARARPAPGPARPTGRRCRSARPCPAGRRAGGPASSARSVSKRPRRSVTKARSVASPSPGSQTMSTRPSSCSSSALRLRPSSISERAMPLADPAPEQAVARPCPGTG